MREKGVETDETAGNAPPVVAPLPLARPRRRIGIWLVLALPLLVVAGLFAFLVLSHRPVPVPQSLVGRLEAQANTALAGRVGVRLGGADVIVERGFVPEVRLNMVQIAQPSGLPIAVLPQLRARLRLEPLLAGRIEAQSLRIGGAHVVLHRLADGRLDLALAPAGAQGGARGGLADLDLTDPTRITEAIEAAFATPLLAPVAEITAEDLRIRLDDTRLNRVWEVRAGEFRLVQDARQIALTLAFDVGERDRLPAQVALSASTAKDGPRAELGIAVTDVPAADLAVQTPALAMLGLLDAPISGTLQSGITDQGGLRGLEAGLRIGAGALRPVEGARPLPFEGADLRLRYDPRSQRVEVARLDLQSPALRLAASGQVLLRDFGAGLPREALVQVALSDIAADPEGLFETPARISQGALDLRLRLDPFRVELGQVQLVEGARRIAGRGQVAAGPEGWSVAFDTSVNEIGAEDLLALWPKALVPPTRAWMAQNVATGQLRNVRAAVRLAPGAEPRVELGYEFRGAEVTVLRTLPPVREGRGFAGITEMRHTLMVEEGRLEAPSGGDIEVADSVMTVPDIREIPARAEVRLVTRAPIPAALSLLDEKPFEFLRKAGRGTDIAQGWAEARTTLRFAMKNKLMPEDVDFDVVARLSDVTSDRLVPGHVIAAPHLTLVADRAGMTVSGAGKFDIVPFQGRWAQRFGPEHRGRSKVDGFVEITSAALSHLRIALPKGAVAGEGWGHLQIDLMQGQAPRYDFVTDLRGLSLSIPEIGWTKAEKAQGRLALAGALGAVPSVERLEAEAPGLRAEGRLGLTAAGFETAQFSQLDIGQWFSGAAELRARGPGQAPDVVVQGGTLDLGALPARGLGGAASAGGGRIEATLDRVSVTRGIVLAPFTGRFTTRGGFAGAFAGRVNGGPQIEGSVVPAKGGRAAVRITGADGGAVLEAAGLFAKARGGALDLTLTPLEAKSYDGRLRIANLKVRDAPVLASMLSAASVIGLLEQLNGDGILFADVAGAFRLTPQGVTISAGEAIGASMGVTMTGNYYPQTQALQMEGVVTPFYLVNAIGQIFAARPGEGLFGFTYRIDGTAKAPRIFINPLSIFTPGMFREIFRRAPPKLVTE